MDHFFSTSSSSIVKQLLWRLERVRIVCSMESEFDKHKHGRYYVHEVDSGKKFVLVRELIDGSEEDEEDM